MSKAFNEGVAARRAGVEIAEVPYFSRLTKLGTRVPTAEGEEWIAGWTSVQRFATKKELADAEKLDISKFRRKSNRYYAS